MHIYNWKKWTNKVQLWTISKRFVNSNSCEQAWANNLKDLEKKHINKQFQTPTNIQLWVRDLKDLEKENNMVQIKTSTNKQLWLMINLKDL
jgi:hypothetical protein